MYAGKLFVESVTEAEGSRPSARDSLSFDPATWFDAIAQIMPRPTPSTSPKADHVERPDAAAASAEALAAAAAWEFEAGHGAWHVYPPDVNAALRGASAVVGTAHGSRIEYTAANGATYEIVLSADKPTGTHIPRPLLLSPS